LIQLILTRWIEQVRKRGLPPLVGKVRLFPDVFYSEGFKGFVEDGNLIWKEGAEVE
jgi:hypothetical protein